MENPVSFELRMAAHQQQVAQINAEDWKYQTGNGPLDRLRAALATLMARRASKPTPAPRPIGETAATPAL
jgi:hypothetical protein